MFSKLAERVMSSDKKANQSMTRPEEMCSVLTETHVNLLDE